jgi:hypothetical protein
MFMVDFVFYCPIQKALDFFTTTTTVTARFGKAVTNLYDTLFEVVVLKGQTWR